MLLFRHVYCVDRGGRTNDGGLSRNFSRVSAVPHEILYDRRAGTEPLRTSRLLHTMQSLPS